jgi:hypothetical protein
MKGSKLKKGLSLKAGRVWGMRSSSDRLLKFIGGSVNDPRLGPPFKEFIHGELGWGSGEL